MVRKAVCFLVVGFGFAVIVAPAWAHHSHVAYEPEKTVWLEGVLKEVTWRNPHMHVTLDVPAKDGKIENWAFEVAGVSSTLQSGVTPEVLKVGNRVKILAHPSRDPNKRLALFLGIEYNGKVYARGTRARGDEVQ